MSRFFKILIILPLLLPFLSFNKPPANYDISSDDALGESVSAANPPAVVPSPVVTSVQRQSSPSPISKSKILTKTNPSPTISTVHFLGTADLNSAVNEWRKARGQGTLIADGKICKAASERAGEIASDFSHDKFLDAVNRNNIDYKSISENIAMNSRITVARVVDQWDKSPHHHEAMLGDFNFGCGAIVGNYAEFMFLKK